jgi:purine-nucleoside phosphorylase
MGNEAPFDASVDAIKRVVPVNLQSPRVGIICGSGLSGIVNNFRDVVLIPYENIPGFSKSTGEWAVGFLNDSRRI